MGKEIFPIPNMFRAIVNKNRSRRPILMREGLNIVGRVGSSESGLGFLKNSGGPTFWCTGMKIRDFSGMSESGVGKIHQNLENCSHSSPLRICNPHQDRTSGSIFMDDPAEHVWILDTWEKTFFSFQTCSAPSSIKMDPDARF